MADSSIHIIRIKSELRDAGMTSFGRNRMASRYLPKIIHESEKIKAVAYGRRRMGGPALLVATDRRLLFVVRKPLFTEVDEIAFDVVSGVEISIQGPFARLVLHTRIRNYVLKYANIKSAKKFADFIELECLEKKGTYRV